ncbi:hypothetical protein ACLKA7_017582 [Drosophila subpalustris]
MSPPRAAEIVDFPDLVAPLPYLNFLRYFKRKHPRYGTRRLLQEALPHWDALTSGQKKLFQSKRILARTARCPYNQRRILLKIKTLKSTKRVTRPIYSGRYPVGQRTRRNKRK